MLSREWLVKVFVVRCAGRPQARRAMWVVSTSQSSMKWVHLKVKVNMSRGNSWHMANMRKHEAKVLDQSCLSPLHHSACTPVSVFVPGLPATCWSLPGFTKHVKSCPWKCGPLQRAEKNSTQIRREHSGVWFATSMATSIRSRIICSNPKTPTWKIDGSRPKADIRTLVARRCSLIADRYIQYTLYVPLWRRGLSGPAIPTSIPFFNHPNVCLVFGYQRRIPRKAQGSTHPAVRCFTAFWQLCGPVGLHLFSHWGCIETKLWWATLQIYHIIIQYTYVLYKSYWFILGHVSIGYGIWRGTLKKRIIVRQSYSWRATCSVWLLCCGRAETIPNLELI